MGKVLKIAESAENNAAESHSGSADISRRKFLKGAVSLLGVSSFGALKAGEAFAGESSREPRVMLGVDVLSGMLFSPLAGKRVGLLTNPAGVNRYGVSTINVLRSSRKFRLVSLFGPEHGIYGNERAEVPVEGGVDRRTGLPVYSLYGKYRKPTPKMLSGLDALVVDLQDVGSRSYTYVSCMIRAMEACFECGKEIIVLDRPNPMGGLKVDGPPLDIRLKSYVGMLRVPYVHAMTIGELARFAKGTRDSLEITSGQRRNGKLTVIPMRGWRRSMMWNDTGLRWVPTSPAIPTPSAAMGYAMTGLGCQIGGFKHGYGTKYPFRMLSYPGVSNASLARILRRCDVAGLRYTPVSAKASGSKSGGVYVGITDWRSLSPTAISFHMMRLACVLSKGNPFAAATKSQASLFNKHTGTESWWREISSKGAKADVEKFLSIWKIYCRNFQSVAKQFYLYS